MNEIIDVGNVPALKLPQTTFSNSAAYFTALADLHMVHLKHQTYRTISKASMFRVKYLARALFRQLAIAGMCRTSTSAFNSHGLVDALAQ